MSSYMKNFRKPRTTFYRVCTYCVNNKCRNVPYLHRCHVTFLYLYYQVNFVPQLTGRAVLAGFDNTRYSNIYTTTQYAIRRWRIPFHVSTSRVREEIRPTKLAEHNLLSLQERRKYLRLVFLFKVVEGSVAAIPLGGYRLLHTTAAEGCSTCENFQGPRHQHHPFRFPLHVTNNSRCFRVPPSKSEPYRHSFFVRIIIIDWNHLEYAVWTLRRVKRCVNAKRPTVSPAHSGREKAQEAWHLRARCVNSLLRPVPV